MEAVEKVGNRMVFGSPLFLIQWVMDMYDADTRGKRTSSGTLGYDLEGDSLKINPAEAEVVRYIFNKFIVF